jgi:hypothetical protein
MLSARVVYVSLSASSWPDSTASIHKERGERLDSLAFAAIRENRKLLNPTSECLDPPPPPIELYYNSRLVTFVRVEWEASVEESRRPFIASFDSLSLRDNSTPSSLLYEIADEPTKFINHSEFNCRD